MNFHWKSLISGWCSQGHEQRGRPSAWRETGLHHVARHDTPRVRTHFSLSWATWAKENHYPEFPDRTVEEPPATMCNPLGLGCVLGILGMSIMLKLKVKQLAGPPIWPPFSWVLMIDIDEEILSTWNQDHLRFSDREVSSQNVKISRVINTNLISYVGIYWLCMAMSRCQDFFSGERTYDVPTCSNVCFNNWQERVEVLHALSWSHFSSVATQLRVMWTPLAHLTIQ